MIFEIISLFALLPIINFSTLYLVSKSRNTLHMLKGLYALTILDWVFVPFNFLIAYSISFSWKLFAICLSIALIPIIILHYKWHKICQKPSETKYLTTDKGLTTEGWIHFTFMIIQISMALTFIFSKAIYPYYYFALVCLISYFVGYLIIIKFVRRIKIISKVEFPLVILGLIALIIRALIKY